LQDVPVKSLGTMSIEKSLVVKPGIRFLCVYNMAMKDKIWMAQTTFGDNYVVVVILSGG